MLLSTIVSFALYCAVRAAPAPVPEPQATFAPASIRPLPSLVVPIRVSSATADVPITVQTFHAIKLTNNGTGLIKGNITRIPTKKLLLPPTIDLLFAPTFNVNLTLVPALLFDPTHIFNLYPNCEAAIDAKATALAQNVGIPSTPAGVITDSATAVHKNYIWGQIYCNPSTRIATAVYGQIWLKYKTTPFLGYPTTDETPTTDGLGNAVRYNLFSNHGAIFWSPSDGAHAIYGDIYAKWKSFNGLKNGRYGIPINDESSPPNDKVGRYNDFKHGGSIYWSPSTGSHLLYGDIKGKFLALGGTRFMGYPTSDEQAAGSSDVGARFTNFNNGGAIYWTPARGAFAIYGDIFASWINAGGVNSDVGYPVSDETSSGTHGGRYNDFSNGMLYWQRPGRIVFWYTGGPSLPDTVTLTWANGIHMKHTDGFSTITLNSNGNVRWQSGLHIDVPWIFDWSIAWLLTSADAQPVQLSQKGSIGPNLGFFGGNKDANVDTTVFSAEVRDNWRAWQFIYWSAQADESSDWLGILKELYNDIKAAWPYVSAAIALLA